MKNGLYSSPKHFSLFEEYRKYFVSPYSMQGGSEELAEIVAHYKNNPSFKERAKNSPVLYEKYLLGKEYEEILRKLKEK